MASISFVRVQKPYYNKEVQNNLKTHITFNHKWYTTNPLPYIVNLKCCIIYFKPYTLNHKPLNTNTKSWYTSDSSIP